MVGFVWETQSKRHRVTSTGCCTDLGTKNRFSTSGVAPIIARFLGCATVLSWWQKWQCYQALDQKWSFLRGLVRNYAGLGFRPYYGLMGFRCCPHLTGSWRLFSWRSSIERELLSTTNMQPQGKLGIFDPHPSTCSTSAMLRHRLSISYIGL